MRIFVFVFLFVNTIIILITYKLGLQFNYYSEFVSLLVVLYSIIYFSQTGLVNKYLNCSIILFLYFFIVIIKNKLPYVVFVQVFLYLKLIFFYLFYNLLSDSKKNEFIAKLYRLMNFLLILVLVGVFIEIISPNFFYDIFGVDRREGRGINGFFISSFFARPTVMGQFCIIYIMIWYIYNKVIRENYTSADIIKLVVISVILFLTFSRKEVLIGLLFILLYPYSEKYKKIRLYLLICLSPFVVLYYLYFMGQDNSISLSTEYNRYKIMQASLTVIQDYFPFGSGPGTFGSQMSVFYSNIYDKYAPNLFGVNNDKYLYDVFLFTFYAEIGIAFFVYLNFFRNIYRCKSIISNSMILYIKKYILITFFILIIFTPIIMNPMGLMLISVVGLLNVNESY